MNHRRSEREHPPPYAPNTREPPRTQNPPPPPQGPRYIPRLGEMDPQPFEDEEQRYVYCRNLHSRPALGVADGFEWDVLQTGKLVEIDRENQIYLTGEVVIPLPARSQETIQARPYPHNAEIANVLFEHSNTAGHFNGFYSLVDIHRGILIRTRMEQETSTITTTPGEKIVLEGFHLPKWASRSHFLGSDGLKSRDNVNEWEPIRVPSIDQPHLTYASTEHLALWLAIHGNVIDYPGVNLTDSGWIDKNTVEGYRILRILDPSHGAQHSEFRSFFILIISLPKFYGQLIEVNHLSISPTVKLMTCPYQPKNVSDVARHMAACGITETQADDLLQYGRIYCMDKLTSQPKSTRDVGPWLFIWRRSNMRMLVSDCIPSQDPAFQIP
ncbi:hypothetical protein BT96DRAFT_440055 [Gymnopus androsaceus JB14]|uniref:Uncharacterized protein n=1 Tax=Gymnopus androsaceus JB14 TaxID=1447944 RepID=A0A6A4I5U1_9AGAR|nr:hypothetical protein BT96DRAFT_440055 [Gymnopus androsaceus JB14]